MWQNGSGNIGSIGSGNVFLKAQPSDSNNKQIMRRQKKPNSTKKKPQNKKRTEKARIPNSKQTQQNPKNKIKSQREKSKKASKSVKKLQKASKSVKKKKASKWRKKKKGHSLKKKKKKGWKKSKTDPFSPFLIAFTTSLTPRFRILALAAEKSPFLAFFHIKIEGFHSNLRQNDRNKAGYGLFSAEKRPKTTIGYGKI
jgi:flagellar biosynthesis GTPase FlhF